MAPITAVRQFDVVDGDPSDHFYYNAECIGVVCNRNYTTKTKFDAIMRERKQLEQDMSDSIFIRAYKCEISLLRAAIVGLPGTPYHNFLFFFDICLPTSYPSIPPVIRYQGFDVVDINPVLGFKGRIFYKRIKDLSEKPSICWDPKSSTLLQHLLAIQAVVFDEKPYYHGCLHMPFAGKNTQERWAAEYNDKVLQRCCVLTNNILKRPPRNFKDLVATHFHKRRLEIVTNLVEAGQITFKECSELVLALAKNEAPVEHSVRQMSAKKEARKLAEKKENKIIDKLSRLFSKNSIQIGSKRYIRLPGDEIDL